MGVIVKKTDFSLYQGINTTRTWLMENLFNGGIIPYDMTGKTIVLRAFNRSEPPVQLYELSSTVSSSAGILTFTLLATHSNYSSPFDYLLIEDPVGTPIVIGNGVFTPVPISGYIPFAEIIANETPSGIIIPANYITLKSYEWRLHLQNAIDPHISDNYVQDENAWPLLVNILIAKLVVYDYMLKALKGLVALTGGDSEGSGNVKKIVTGPTEAEFFDSMGSISAFARIDKNGNSPLSDFALDICQLARRLKIYLFMCKNHNTDPHVPLKAERPDCIPTNINKLIY